MNQLKQNETDFARLLAMVNTVIKESIYHTQTFAHALKIHHNDKAANVFLLACEQFIAEQVIVMNHAKNIDLPNIPPWEAPYPEYRHPSSLLIDAHYAMSEDEARKLTDEMIEIHDNFYNFLLKESRTDKVISLVNSLVKSCKTERSELL